MRRISIQRYCEIALNDCYIEILTFEGCPNEELARDRVDAALRASLVSARVRIVRVESPERATELKFLGSPSVRVGGEDVEIQARASTSFGMMCRTYKGGTEGAPSIEIIAAAIKAWRTSL
jgi:hypothetical protein